MSGAEDPGGWERLEELFHRAAELPPDRIEAFLDAECDGDAELRGQVASLLAAATEAGGFFDSLSERVFSGGEGSDDAASALSQLYDPLLGTAVAQYEIEELLGSGGMGRVYRGYDTVLRRHVALKFLPVASRFPEARARFYVEARAAAAIRHDNICEIHEIGETEEGQPYIVMPLYEGQTVAQRLETGPLPIAEALDCGLQACAGLARAHETGVIHRDVKPGNLFLTRDGTVKVLDFGLAKLADVTLTVTGRPLGTLSYVSPEQVRGDGVDARTDVWSLGVVLYEMLSGKPPFRGANAAAVIEAILKQRARPLAEVVPELPRAVAEAVHGALSKDRKRRTRSVGELAARLRAAREG